MITVTGPRNQRGAGSPPGVDAADGENLYICSTDRTAVGLTARDLDMDINNYYIWQSRIRHGIRLQRGTVPFPESVKLGLEFNGALKRKEMLNEHLLTNAVMLEIYDFAKAVTKSEKYFLFEMLEHNFDLGLDVEDGLQYYEYALRVYNKVKLLKEQLRQKPHRRAQVFQLPDANTIKAFTASEAPGRYYPKRPKAADVSLLTHGSSNRQCPENGSGGVSSMFPVKRKGGSAIYPLCGKLGVTLAVRPDEKLKEKLAPHLLTVSVMMELLNVSRCLCGTVTQLVFDLVKGNFGKEWNKPHLRTQLNKLAAQKYIGLLVKNKDTFLKKIFTVQTKRQEPKYKKRKTPDDDVQDVETLMMISKRKESLRPSSQDVLQDTELSYTCPVESETQLRAEGNELSTALVSLDVEQEVEEVFVPVAEGCNSRDLVSKAEHKDVKAPKHKLWRRRAARANQILTLSRVSDLFTHSRRTGLDFNVGSGVRRSLDLQLLTNWVLWELVRFATMMTKSIRSFLVDILENNFNLSFQDDQLQSFTSYMITKEKYFQSHPARQTMEFLSSAFQLPEAYATTDMMQQVDGVAGSQSVDMDPYPFCKSLGIDLWATQEQPSSQKLHLSILTPGAVFEIFRFIGELCGSAREMVCDLLEHNFDLDLHSGASKAAHVLQRWFITQKSLTKNQNMSPKIRRWLNMVVPFNGPSQFRPQPRRKGLEADDPKVKGNKKVDSYRVCEEIGLDLDVRSKSPSKAKLDLRVLTREVLFEVHRYVERNCHRYVPDLYEILEHNFDLSSQSHRKVEFAWSVASQVLAMVAKSGRQRGYMSSVFELPMEPLGSSQLVCKEEPQTHFGDADVGEGGDNDVEFVRKLKPVDIEVELE